ncbi:MAG: hypothetical protein FJ033_13305 [Chloroflexi bacterium]|nr:hypothetical protein [Chloroflexota bacterium]
MSRNRRLSRIKTDDGGREPIVIVGAIVIGLVVALVAVPRVFSGQDPRVESYVLYASQLHAQGESPQLLRDRLVSVGIGQPATTVLNLAERYATSRDSRQRHDAEALDAFGKALLSPTTATFAAPTAARSTPVAFSSGDEVMFAPVSTPTPIVLGQPGVSIPTPTPGLSAASATATPRGESPSAATPRPAITGSTGVIKPTEGGNAILRAEPKRGSASLALIPNGAEVRILGSIQGDRIEGEGLWYQVQFGDHKGWVWSRLVVIAR